MEQEQSRSYITLIWMLSIIISIDIGNFVLKILETTPLNFWISRIGGCAIAVISELIFYYFWIIRIKK